jgi:hypothetical protein
LSPRQRGRRRMVVARSPRRRISSGARPSALGGDDATLKETGEGSGLAPNPRLAAELSVDLDAVRLLRSACKARQAEIARGATMRHRSRYPRTSRPEAITLTIRTNGKHVATAAGRYAFRDSTYRIVRRRARTTPTSGAVGGGVRLRDTRRRLQPRAYAHRLQTICRG